MLPIANKSIRNASFPRVKGFRVIPGKHLLASSCVAFLIRRASRNDKKNDLSWRQLQFANAIKPEVSSHWTCEGKKRFQIYTFYLFNVILEKYYSYKYNCYKNLQINSVGKWLIVNRYKGSFSCHFLYLFTVSHLPTEFICRFL